MTEFPGLIWNYTELCPSETMSATVISTFVTVASLLAFVHGSFRLPPSDSMLPNRDTEPNEDGPTCGQYNKICIQGSECVDGACVCPASYPVGFGYFDCVPERWIQCRVCGDPHLNGFGGAETSLNLPCRYRLASIKTPSSRRLNNFCTAKVFATNVFRNGRFYAEILDGEIEIGRLIGSDNLYRFTANRDQVTLTNTGTGKARIIRWGAMPLDEELDGHILRVQFDTVQNYVTISVRRCFLQIKFRFPDPNTVGQRRVPCVSISTLKYGIYPWSFHIDGKFPSSLCGTKSDDKNLFKDSASEFNLESRNYAALYGFLSNVVDQNQGEHQATCTAIIDEYGECGEKKVDAINLCGPILYDNDLVKCLYDNKIENILDIYRQCILGFCGSSKDACDQVKITLSACKDAGPSTLSRDIC